MRGNPIIHVRVDRATASRLASIAHDRGDTVSDLVRDLIRAALDDQYSGDSTPQREEVAGQLCIDDVGIV